MVFVIGTVEIKFQSNFQSPNLPNSFFEDKNWETLLVTFTAALEIDGSNHSLVDWSGLALWKNSLNKVESG